MCATDEKVGREEEARRAVGSATFFSFSLPDPLVSKRTIRQCGSSGVPLRICGVCMGFLGRGGIRMTTRISTHKGTDFLRPQDARRQSASSQLSILNTRLERCNAVVVGQQGLFGAGVVERGDQTRQTRLSGWIPTFSRADHGPMGERHTRALQVLVQWRLWAPD